MKIKTNQSKKEFQPIELNITIESEKELYALLAQLTVNLADLDSPEQYYLENFSAPKDFEEDHDGLMVDLFCALQDIVEVHQHKV